MASVGLAKSLSRLRLLTNLKVPASSVHAALSTSAAAWGQQDLILSSIQQEAFDKPLEESTYNKAAINYLEKVTKHDDFMAGKVSEFEIGRRHLANMMGKDPVNFTQDDINSAIAYLFPSGLFEPRARPQMLPPDQVFPDQKEAQFDITGRPHHTLFYTLKPHFYQIMHDITEHMVQLNKYEDEVLRKSTSQVEVIDRLTVDGTEWLTHEKMEIHLKELLKEFMYRDFVTAMTRLLAHPYSRRVEDFIMAFRKPLLVVAVHQIEETPQIQLDDAGRQCVIGQGTRKTAKAIVKVLLNGKGDFNINGQSILYFRNPQDREQVLLPLQLSGLLQKVDIVSNVTGGGTTGQSGAIRYALSVALQALVDDETIEAMRISGILTLDRRRIERKKPGQKGARAKFTWRKR